jgi:hypothetical protein
MYNLPCFGLLISVRNKVAVDPPFTQSGSSDILGIELERGRASKVLSDSEYSAIVLS